MVYYFIDFENVMSAGLKGIEDIFSYDKVTVFYSNMAHMVDIHCIEKIFAAHPHNIDFQEVQNGTTNALDFHLIVCLTNAICKNIANTYVIISNDKGYDAAIAEWKRLYGIDVVRRSTIHDYIYPEKSNRNNTETVSHDTDGSKTKLTEANVWDDIYRLCGFTVAAQHIPIIINAWETAKSDKEFFIKELQAKNGIRTGMAKKKAEKMRIVYDEWVERFL